METNNNHDNDTNSKKTFVLGIAGGLALAAALGAGFMFGGRTGGSASDARAASSAPTTAVSTTAQVASTVETDGTDGTKSTGQAPAVEPEQPGEDEPAGEEPEQGAGDESGVTVTPDAEEPEDEDDATVTPEPGDGCAFCIDPEIVIPTVEPDPDPCPFCIDPGVIVIPTVEPGCPECVADVDLGVLLDVTPPTIDVADYTFCYPILMLFVDVDAPAEVWFEFDYDGAHYESNHADAANDAVIADDLGSLDWSVYLVPFVEVHAIDLSGNHAIMNYAMPDPDLGC
jgi:hypothetical protein